MSISQELRKQANNIGANVADAEGNDIRETLNRLVSKVERLERDSKFLDALYACGLDNWDGIDFAIEMVEEEE
jgi:hypothetical protein